MGFITKSSWSNIPKVLDRNCSLLIRLLRQAQGKDMEMDKLQMSLKDQLRTAAAQVHFVSR